MKGPGNPDGDEGGRADLLKDAVNRPPPHGFDLIEAPGTQGRVFLRKYNVSAAIQKNGDDGVKIFAYPGYLIGSEISKSVNKGYQQFLKTSKNEVPATADHLKALQQFTEELNQALAHQLVQRVVGYGQRSLPIRSRERPRQTRSLETQTPLGSRWSEGGRGRKENPDGILRLKTAQSLVCGIRYSPLSSLPPPSRVCHLSLPPNRIFYRPAAPGFSEET